VRVEAAGVEAAYFNLPGVMNLERHNGAIRFFYKGDINTVMSKISALTLSDVSIEEPTLEEIFMHYYE
jgi:ABC-2 type transport system ATP-binding protein